MVSRVPDQSWWRPQVIALSPDVLTVGTRSLLIIVKIVLQNSPNSRSTKLNTVVYLSEIYRLDTNSFMDTVNVMFVIYLFYIITLDLQNIQNLIQGQKYFNNNVKFE